MSDHLEQRINDLEDLIRAQARTPTPSSVEQSVDKSGKYLRWLQSVIALIVVVVGMGVTWGLTQGKITTLETKVATMQQTYDREHELYQKERAKLRGDLTEMQVKQAAVDQLLTSIRDDITEIKTDVKAMAERRSR